MCKATGYTDIVQIRRAEETFAACEHKLGKMFVFLDSMDEAERTAHDTYLESPHTGRRPERHMEPACHAELANDFLDRQCQSQNL